MAQQDFDILAMEHSSPAHCLNSDHRACKIDKEDEGYVPVNFIPESVYSMIKAWQMSRTTKREDPMDVSGSADVDMIGSDIIESNAGLHGANGDLRRQVEMLPPKPFYRRFWASISRRLMERDRETLLAC